MIETMKLHILILVWMMLTFIQGHSCLRNQNSMHFLTNLSINFNEIQYVATTCWFLEAHANFFCFVLHK